MSAHVKFHLQVVGGGGGGGECREHKWMVDTGGGGWGKRGTAARISLQDPNSHVAMGWVEA